MTRREAKRSACGVVARLIASYKSVGQPYDDCRARVRDWTMDDYDALIAAFDALQAEMERRS